MPYARAPGRSVTAATSGRARRDSLGTSIGHEAARDGRAPYGPAALGAPAPLGAGAAIDRHRYVHRPPIGRLPPVDAGATVVELAPVASAPAVGERFVTHGASRWRRVGGKLIGRRGGARPPRAGGGRRGDRAPAICPPSADRSAPAGRRRSDGRRAGAGRLGSGGRGAVRNPWRLSLAAGGGQTYRPARSPARVMLALSTTWTPSLIHSSVPRWAAPSQVATYRPPDGSARSPPMRRTGPSSDW